MQNLDDAVLWLASNAGTSNAFGEIFDRHRGAVFRKAYARVRTRVDAEDVVAIVFLEAWRKRGSVRIVDGSVLPWLLTTTTYVCMNLDRSKRRHRIAVSRIGPPTHEPDHAEAVHGKIEQIERSMRLTDAMSRLPKRDQIVLELCIVDELPQAHVAALLELPIGTVKSRLSRARAKLRVDLMDLPGGDTVALGCGAAS